VNGNFMMFETNIPNQSNKSKRKFEPSRKIIASTNHDCREQVKTNIQTYSPKTIQAKNNAFGANDRQTIRRIT